MISKFASTCFMAAAFTALPVLAGETHPLECAANQEKVWVYDSLESFQVKTKLACGETVEVLSRAKGFVKIRSAAGQEGYVPDTAVPKPAVADASSDNSADNTSLAARARAYRAAKASGTAQPAAPAVAKAIAPTPAPVPVAAPVASANVVVAQPTPVALSKAKATAPEQPKAATAPVEVVLSSSSASPSPNREPSASTHTAARAPQPNTETVRTVNAPSSTVKPSTKPAPSTAARPNSKPAPSTSKPHAPAQPPATAAPQVVTISSAPDSSRSLPAAGGTTAANLSNAKLAVDSSDDPDNDEYPLHAVEDESANPSCQAYFSAYGLTTSQYKWLMDNRRKRFPGICPAASPATVDFVMIFTHDVAFFNSTMPTAVRVDHGGFSDFNPMTMADNALASPSELEKSHHEYVWIFQTKRGAFDPSRFSPRRKPQFTKMEANGLGSSHANTRTLEDAFQFAQEHGGER